VSELIVVRHGEAEGNARGIVQGRRPYPLTETGRRQAQAVARLIRRIGWAPARIVTSPVARTVETAGIVAAQLELPDATCVAGFAEIDPGSAVGTSLGELTAWGGMEEHGGESVDALYRRVGEALDQLPDDESVVLVTHGCVFKATLAHLLGWGGDYWLELRCGTCMRLVRKSAEIHAFTHLIHPEEMELQ